MALGTITNLAVDPHSTSQSIPLAVGDVKITVSTVVGDSAYSAGGTALSGLQLGLPMNTVLFAICFVSNAPANAGSLTNALATSATYNVATGKLQMWAAAGTTPNLGLNEATGNLSALTVTVVAFGY